MPKTARKVKDKNAPKKPLSAYMCFANDTRQKCEDIKAMKVTEQAKAIGAKWKELSDSEKEPYEKMAKVDKERYDKQMEAYKMTPDYAKFVEMTENQKKSKKQAKPAKKGKMTGQKLFLKEFKENLSEEEKGQLTEGLSKAAMAKWKELSKEKKAEYNERAKESTNSEE